MSLYSTTNSQYGPNWLINQQQSKAQSQNVQSLNVPTWSEIGKGLNEYDRNKALLKNQTVSAKWGDKNFKPEGPVKFPVKAEEYKYPEQGLKVGNPLYMTTYMDIGRLKPTSNEVPEDFYPQDNNFTSTFSGGNYKYDGLNTNFTNSKVHNAFNEF